MGWAALIKSGLIDAVNVPFLLLFIPEMISASRIFWGDGCEGGGEAVSFGTDNVPAACEGVPTIWVSIFWAKSLILGINSSMFWIWATIATGDLLTDMSTSIPSIL